MESVIFSSPFLIVLYCVALFFSIVGLKNKTGVILSSVSVALCLLTTGYALFKGATLLETAIVLLIFLIINLIGFGEEGKNK